MTEGITQRTFTEEKQLIKKEVATILLGQNKAESGKSADRGAARSSNRYKPFDVLARSGKESAENFMQDLKEIKRDIKENPHKYFRQTKPSEIKAAAEEWKIATKKYDEAYQKLLNDPQARKLLEDEKFNEVLTELKKLRDPRYIFYFKDVEILRDLFEIFADPKYGDFLHNKNVLNFIQASVSLVKASDKKFAFQLTEMAKRATEEFLRPIVSDKDIKAKPVKKVSKATAGEKQAKTAK
ncbi:MAG: hypothetical protein NZT61_03040 [Deltaproteobacteria bacterium]|nr:hypothetical protein [Deltaproteobacteria bacterium]